MAAPVIAGELIHLCVVVRECVSIKHLSALASVPLRPAAVAASFIEYNKINMFSISALRGLM